MTSGIPSLPGLADLSPLGQGGLADVYLARQIHLERWVAAKVFRVSLADEQAADRFRAECRALGRIDQYPDIITVYDAGVLPDGRPYLISERCEGSLADLVDAEGPLPEERVAAIGLTVARALEFAHSAGVLHGDVTPQNVLLRSSGAPVLADFGLAVLRDHRARTAAGFTMAHAAPEVLDAGAPIDEAADVYGLGSTLYAALTGRPPFPRHPGEDDRERLDRIRTEPVEPPSGRLSGLLVAMLAKQPEQRPSTDDVVDALGGRPTADPTQWIPAAAPGDATTRVPAAAAPSEATTWLAAPGGEQAAGERTRLQHAPGPSGDRPGKRRWAPVAVGALVVLALGGAAYALSRPSEQPPPAAVTPTSAAAPPPSPSAGPTRSSSAEPTASREPRSSSTTRRTPPRTARPTPSREAPRPTTEPPRPTPTSAPEPTSSADPSVDPTDEQVAPRQRTAPQQQPPGGRRAGEPSATAEDTSTE